MKKIKTIIKVLCISFTAAHIFLWSLVGLCYLGFSFVVWDFQEVPYWSLRVIEIVAVIISVILTFTIWEDY